MASPAVSTPLERLVGRFDASVFELGRPRARLRIEGASDEPTDVVIDAGGASIAPPERGRPDAVLSADPETWEQMAEDIRGGMDAFRRGRLRIRHDLHLGVGFLAATTATSDANRLRFSNVETAAGTLSTIQAGSGDPVVLLHGLGATKASFLPSVAALAGSHRAIAVDLPGFGDSDKPLWGSYDAPFFARAVSALLDALELGRAHFVGNSLGGRVALELALREPERVGRLVLLAPSLAWLRSRRWAPYLRLVPTQLGLIQPAPRAIVEQIVRRVIPGADNEWTAVGIDEFLRSYLTPQGRAAFYATARKIYLEEARGPHGFWTRVASLQPEALFVWGRRDSVVPIGFARHVREALPRALHLELECGHVPQLERPRETHRAMVRFLEEGRI
jgi:pimeloyl-ACP methyl ester carboxylesterase